MDKTDQLRLLKGFNFSRTQKEKLIKLLNESDSEGGDSKFIDDICIIGVNIQYTNVLDFSTMLDEFSVSAQLKVIYGDISLVTPNKWLFVIITEDNLISNFTNIVSTVRIDIDNSIALNVTHTVADFVGEGFVLKLLFDITEIKNNIQQNNVYNINSINYEIDHYESEGKIEMILSESSDNIVNYPNVEAYRFVTSWTNKKYYRLLEYHQDDPKYFIVELDGIKKKFNIVNTEIDGYTYYRLNFDSNVE